jgi:hypothetical protein
MVQLMKKWVETEMTKWNLQGWIRTTKWNLLHLEILTTTAAKVYPENKGGNRSARCGAGTNGVKIGLAKKCKHGSTSYPLC